MMSSNGINGINGVIVSASVKTEAVDNTESDSNAAIYGNNTSTAESSVVIASNECLNNGIYSPERRRHDSANSSIISITGIAMNANHAKIEFEHKSQHSSVV